MKCDYNNMVAIMSVVIKLRELEDITKDYSPALKKRIADRLHEAVTDIITIPLEEDDTQYPSIEEVL